MPLLEFNPETQVWTIWLAYNKDVTEGTYLVLKPDGEILRQTEQDDIVSSTMRIKDADT